MWNWIKKLFKPWNLEKVKPEEEIKIDLTGLTKGDIKKLKKQVKKKCLKKPHIKNILN